MNAGRGVIGTCILHIFDALGYGGFLARPNAPGVGPYNTAAATYCPLTSNLDSDFNVSGTNSEQLPTVDNSTTTVRPPALKPLPVIPYVLAEGASAASAPEDHVERPASLRAREAEEPGSMTFWGASITTSFWS
jgi:hypothetical protein